MVHKSQIRVINAIATKEMRRNNAIVSMVFLQDILDNPENSSIAYAANYILTNIMLVLYANIDGSVADFLIATQKELKRIVDITGGIRDVE